LKIKDVLGIHAGIAVLPMWSIRNAAVPSVARNSATRSSARLGQRGSYGEITTGVADIARDCPITSDLASAERQMWRAPSRS
jgi:hypothetical protein